jgi:omega-hydroxy-beta-dihydromenaquinone-9 sulfotransferase
MLMYFDIDYYLMLVRQIWLEKRWPGRSRMLVKLLIGIPLMYLIHAFFFFLDKILFPGLWLQKIEKPVFIIGHARSGTTLMHRLLASDSQRFNYFLYWEMFFPSLTEKKLIRLLGVMDRVFLQQYFYKRLKAWDDRVFGPFRHMHNMGLWVPEEDDFVNTFAFTSGYWAVQAPFIHLFNPFYLDRMPEKKQHRWMKYYKESLRRQLYLNGGKKIHLSKNPVFCGRVETLINEFPDARIIVMMRNPNECIPSLLKLIESSWAARKWPKDACWQSLRALADMSFDCYRLPKRALEQHPNVPHYVVDYRDLVSQPKQTVLAVCQTLNLDISLSYQQTLDQEQSKARQHKTSHSYSLAEYGLDSRMIRTQLDEFFEYYRWDEDATADQQRASA